MIDIYRSLQEYNVNITVYDPWANPNIAKREYGIDITNDLPKKQFDSIIMAVAHKEFLNENIESLCKEKRIIFDVKGILDKSIIDGRL